MKTPYLPKTADDCISLARSIREYLDCYHPHDSARGTADMLVGELLDLGAIETREALERGLE